MHNLTYAPIPQWKHIAKAIINKQLSNEKLAEFWLLNNEKSYWFSRSAWSLYVIVKFRILISFDNQVKVWVPSYFCNESLVAIRSLPVTLYFYPVLSNGKPDLTECNKMLVNFNPDIILFVHYFGEEVFSEELYDLAQENDAWLVEDAAHCLKPSLGIGNQGDFVLYSPHKLLAIPDGGLLVIREQGPSKITSNLLEKFNFNEVYDSVINMRQFSNLYTYKWLLKRLIQKLGLHFSHKKIIFNSENKKQDFKKLPHPKMSKLSKKLLSNMTDLDKESENRKNNQKEWNSSLAKNNILGDDINIISCHEKYVPYLAIFVANDTAMAEFFFDLLQTSKIPVSTWPDLPPEVVNNSKRYENAIKMRKTRLFLPIHSSLNPEQIKENMKGVNN
jgi:hypothetical protein